MTAPMTYEECLDNHPEALGLEEGCPECDGTGEVECYACGNLEECEACKGTGVVNGTRDRYARQLKRETALLVAWTNGTPIAPALASPPLPQEVADV